jgi:hypothetical protein
MPKSSSSASRYLGSAAGAEIGETPASSRNRDAGATIPLTAPSTAGCGATTEHLSHRAPTVTNGHPNPPNRAEAHQFTPHRACASSHVRPRMILPFMAFSRRRSEAQVGGDNRRRHPLAAVGPEEDAVGLQHFAGADVNEKGHEPAQREPQGMHQVKRLLDEHVAFV